MINKALVRKHVRFPELMENSAQCSALHPAPWEGRRWAQRGPLLSSILKLYYQVHLLRLKTLSRSVRASSIFIYQYRPRPSLSLSGVKGQDHPNPTAGPAEARGPSSLFSLLLHHWQVWWKRQTELTLVLLDFNYTLKEKIQQSFQGCGKVQEIQKGIPPGNFIIILPKIK